MTMPSSPVPLSATGSIDVPRETARWAYASLFLLAGVVFAPTLWHTFVWDDLEQVRDNEIIRHWSSFKDFWHKDILELSRKGGHHHSNYYRPLFYVQYLLNYQMFGLNTFAWHGLAILHHAMASACVLLFLRTLRFSLGISWMAAALFVVHPAHGESVSWVAAAYNDPPAATCLLLGLAAHAKCILSNRWKYLPLGLLGYAGALCLKESGLSMLLLVPLVEWYAAPRDGWRKRALRYLPYICLTAIYFLVRKLTLGFAFGHYEGTRSFAELAPTFPMLAAFYVRLLLWPFGLAPSYPLRYVEQWSDPRAWACVAGLIVLAAILLIVTRRRPSLQFCCLWIIGCVWPVFNIRSFLPTFLAHQRYLYLASLGVCLAVAWLLHHAIARVSIRRSVLAGLLLLWSASNLYYNVAWRTDHDLWTRICEVDPKNPAGFDWLGAQAMQKSDFDAAEKLFRQAIAADPDSPHSYRNLGVVFRRRRQPEEAAVWLRKALEVFYKRSHNVDPSDVLQCRIVLGAVLAESGRMDDGLREFLSVAETAPYPVEAASNAAVLLWQAGQLDRVEQVLKRGLSRHPNNADLLSKMIDVLKATGRPELAQPYVDRLNTAGAQPP